MGKETYIWDTLFGAKLFYDQRGTIQHPDLVKRAREMMGKNKEPLRQFLDDILTVVADDKENQRFPEALETCHKYCMRKDGAEMGKDELLEFAEYIKETYGVDSKTKISQKIINEIS